MEKQLEILKAMLEGKTIYDKDGRAHGLTASPVVRVLAGDMRYVLTFQELDQFTLTPPPKPLTFERIKKECVSGEHLLVDKHGNKLLFIGFNRRGSLVADCADGCVVLTLGEHSIKEWTIEEYNREE